MRHSPRARPSPPGRGGRPRRCLTGGVLVLVLLIGYLALLLAPRGSAALRLGGLSLLWWYGGIAAPIAGLMGIVLLWPWRDHEGEGSGGDGSPGDAGDHPGSEHP